MHTRQSFAALASLLAACGVSSTLDHQLAAPLAPAGPPVTTSTQSTPLTGEPFVPALSGHHLAIAGDIALVSDPEGPGEDGVQPQLHFASITHHQLLVSLNLPVGSNPQAIAVASDGYAYVIAAGLGGIIAVDIARQVLGSFSAVCPAPVDIATRGADVIVACRGGEVVTFTQAGRETTRLAPGLARLAVDPQGRVFVATSAAQIIEVGVSQPTAPAAVPLHDADPAESRIAHSNTPRRLLALPTGGVAMMFQQSLSGELTETGAPVMYYGGGGATCPMPATRPAMTTYDSDNGFGGVTWAPSTLIIDAAVSPSGKTLAVADAAGGAVRFQELSRRVASDNDVCQPTNPTTPTDDNPGVGASVPAGMPSGVAYTGTTLVVLNSSPVLELQTIPEDLSIPEGQPVPADQRITLRVRHVPEGFAIFHSDPKAVAGDSSPHAQSVACGSCHPEGLSNGATTTIQGITHRVMPLAGHLATATIVHWDGKTFHDAVAESTWHAGMGGDELTADQEAALHTFVSQLKMPSRPDADATTLAAGRAAFTQAGCAMCHVPGNAYTNDGVADVGRGMHKVPSLVGLVYTAPYMSDGCAATLEDRFDDVACGGGQQHGDVAGLSNTQRVALVSFLKTL